MRSLHALRLVEMTKEGRLVEMTKEGRLVEMTGGGMVEMTKRNRFSSILVIDRRS